MPAPEPNQFPPETHEHISRLYRLAEFGRLAGGMFHDLVNPLSAMVMGIGDLQERIDRTVTASKRLERSISRVRKHLGRPENKRTFCMNTEIKEVIELLSHQAAQKSVAFYLRAGERLWIYGSPTKFRHIATNIISNAVDSYAESARATEHIVLIRLSSKKNHAVFSVRDRGCGIPRHLIGRIFDPFFTTKTKQGSRGLGIGLSNAKSIVSRDFGGTIQVESAVGKGSTFTVCLPRAKPKR